MNTDNDNNEENIAKLNPTVCKSKDIQLPSWIQSEHANLVQYLKIK